jgi:hypothetical protein
MSAALFFEAARKLPHRPKMRISVKSAEKRSGHQNQCQLQVRHGFAWMAYDMVFIGDDGFGDTTAIEYRLAEREGLSGNFVRSACIPKKTTIAAGYGILGGLHRRLLFQRPSTSPRNGDDAVVGLKCGMVKALVAD